MAQDEKAAGSDKGKEKEVPKQDANGVNGTKEPLKDKDGKTVKDSVLPPGTNTIVYTNCNTLTLCTQRSSVTRTKRSKKSLTCSSSDYWSVEVSLMVSSGS